MNSKASVIGLSSSALNSWNEFVVTFYVLSIILFVLAYVAAQKQAKSSEKKIEKMAEFFRNAFIQVAALLFSLSSAMLIFNAQQQQQQMVIQLNEQKQRELFNLGELRQVSNALLRRSYAISKSLSSLNNSEFVNINHKAADLCDPFSGDANHSPQVCAYDYVETLVENYRPPITPEMISDIRGSLRISDDVLSSELIAGKLDLPNLLEEEYILNYRLNEIEKDVNEWPHHDWPQGEINYRELLPAILRLMSEYRNFHTQLIFYAYRLCEYVDMTHNIGADYTGVFKRLHQDAINLGRRDYTDILKNDTAIVTEVVSLHDPSLVTDCKPILDRWGLR